VLLLQLQEGVLMPAQLSFCGSTGH